MATSVVRFDEKKFTARTLELQNLVDSIIVRDAESCLRMKTAMRDIRTEIKARKFVLDPFVQDAKDALDKARDRRSNWIDPLQKLDDTGEQKVKDYERMERERAAAEERRINDERRKQAEIEAAAHRKRDEEAAAERRKEEQKRIAEAQKAGELNKREAERAKKEAEERERAAKEQAARDAQAARDSVQDVKVQAAIPTVAGVPSRRNFKFRWYPDGQNILMDAFREQMELRPFVQANDQEIGRMVRDTKNKKLAEERCPGIEVYED
jgi:hypothetical protein